MALQGEARPQNKPRRLKEREAGIVWWQDFMARFRVLPPEEAMMWDAASKGVAFSVLCEMVATLRRRRRRAPRSS
jgi:hypothetical protein